MNKLKMMVLPLAFSLLASGTAFANGIKSVIAVDFLHVEVVMDEPLTQEELMPKAGTAPAFKFNEGVVMTGAPELQKVKDHDNTYRIPVNGLDEDIIYTISYKGQKPFTFKAYDQQDMDERYKNRYGDYF